LVEFALVLPIFLTLVFGILDLGRIVFMKAELENAVREGVRAAQMAAAKSGATCAQVAGAARTAVQAQPLISGAAVAFDPATGCEKYQGRIVVSATLQTDFAAARLLPGLTAPQLRASASGRIE
jgi:Flp pilus assembly protein TadG